MFVYLWEFEVADEQRHAFEAAYGRGGDWERLFSRDAAYLGTELLRDRLRPGRYLTVDRWRSVADRDAFRDRHREAFEDLDRRCESLTRREVPLGELDVVTGVRVAREG